MLIVSKNYSLGNLIFVLALLFLLQVPTASSLITYTTAVVITPQQIMTILNPDSAKMLVTITAESGADSSTVTSEDILHLLIDDDTTQEHKLFSITQVTTKMLPIVIG